MYSKLKYGDIGMVNKGNAMLLEEINRIDMEILAMHQVYLHSDWQCETVCSPYSRIYLVQSGKGMIAYNGKKIEMTAGNIYIIPAELDFSYSCDCYLQKIYFHINLLRYNGYDFLAEHGECIILRDRQEEIEYVTKQWARKDIFQAMSIKSLLYKIVVEAISQEGISLGEIEIYSELIKKAMKVIGGNLKATLTVEDVAEMLYVSPGSLQKRFRREVGVPIGRYVDDRLMFKAEQLLRLREVSIKEISEQLGFCDQFYFSRCFSKRYGISPLKYRKNIFT